jgi:hypothetical protein
VSKRSSKAGRDEAGALRDATPEEKRLMKRPSTRLLAEALVHHRLLSVTPVMALVRAPQALADTDENGQTALALAATHKQLQLGLTLLRLKAQPRASAFAWRPWSPAWSPSALSASSSRASS